MKKQKLQQLIDEAPLYEPQAEAGPDMIVVDSEDVDVVTAAFVEQSKVKYKYNSYDGLSIFSNGKYQLVTDRNEVRLHIRKFLARCRILKKKKGLVPISRKTGGSVKDMIETICSLPDVHLLPSQKAPCSLDGSHDPQTTIAANNCLIDVKEFPPLTSPITDQYYTHNYLTYDYVPKTISELWTKFLVEVTNGNIDLITLLQQWCGYLLLPTLKYQKFLLCVGDGANGKGVFFDTIAAALGKGNVSNVPLAMFVDKHTLFGTYGKLVNMSNESAKDIESSAESVIKEYVAGDKVLWEQKYKDPYFAYPTAKLMFATNELPHIRDITDGIWRRMILAPFDVKFNESEQDRDLADKLQQHENLSGILNWMIEGAIMLGRENGFVEAEVSKKAITEYRNESDSARLFALENLKAVPIGESIQMPCTLLHQWYQDWCKEGGFKPKNDVHFGRSVNQLFPVQKSRPWVGVKKINVYLGMAPQEGSDVETKLAEWTQ